MKISYHSYLLDGQSQREMTYDVTSVQLRALADFMDARGATATHDAQTGLVLQVPDDIARASREEMDSVKALVFKRMKTALTEDETAEVAALHKKLRQQSDASWLFTTTVFDDIQQLEEKLRVESERE